MRVEGKDVRLEVRVESLDEVSRTRFVEKRVYCLTYLNDNDKSSN